MQEEKEEEDEERGKGRELNSAWIMVCFLRAQCKLCVQRKRTMIQAKLSSLSFPLFSFRKAQLELLKLWLGLSFFCSLEVREEDMRARAVP